MLDQRTYIAKHTKSFGIAFILVVCMAIALEMLH